MLHLPRCAYQRHATLYPLAPPCAEAVEIDELVGTCEVRGCAEPEHVRITVPGRFLSMCLEHLLDYRTADHSGTRREWMDANLSQ